MSLGPEGRVLFSLADARMRDESLKQTNLYLEASSMVGLGLPAMVTQLLAALANSSELRTYAAEKKIVTLGWDDQPPFTGFPVVSYVGTPRVTVMQDPLPPDLLFAFVKIGRAHV